MGTFGRFCQIVSINNFQIGTKGYRVKGGQHIKKSGYLKTPCKGQKCEKPVIWKGSFGQELEYF